jgi:hypothetical protein
VVKHRLKFHFLVHRPKNSTGAAETQAREAA